MEDKTEKPAFEAMKLMEVNGYHNEDKSLKPVSTFRRMLPQVLASAAQNLLIFGIALAMNFPTIVIPALKGIKNRDPDETLTFTDEQGSWFASIAYICQPIGSVLSGVIVEHLGRKRAMMVVNIPHIIAWLMLYFAKNIETMFIADVLLGLGVGFMEAPVITYVGEISEPSIRGVLVSMAQIAYAIGLFLLYTIGGLTSWRNTALICCGVPVFTMICISMIAETPHWLLSKGRKDDALKALQWLRGWVPPKLVEKEFDALLRYNENSNSCSPCQKIEKKCIHPRPNFKQKIKELFRRKTLMPFCIIMLMFFFAVFNANTAMRPYYLQIFEQYNLVIDANTMAILVGISGVIGNLVCAAAVKIVGKRKTTLSTLAGICILCTILAVYTWKDFPAGMRSFVKPNYEGQEKTYLFIFLFLGIVFFTNAGIISTPWIYVGEMYPNKTRGMACGITAALVYSMGFVSAKTYYSLETSLSLVGVISLYAALSLIAIVLLYLIVPITEGRTLEDIEDHFSNKKVKFTDRCIEKQKKPLLN